MPILHEWDSTDGYLRTVLIGPVGFEDMCRHLEAVARADAFGRAELIDARAVDGPPPSLSELRRLAGRARDLMGKTPPGPRAIVIDGSPVNTLVAELFSVFMAGPMQIDVFTSEAAARRWLREQSTPTRPEVVGREQQAS